MREMIESSTVDFEGIDVQEMLLYVRLNLDDCTDVASLIPFLPTRRHTGGRTPAMCSESIIGPHKQAQLKDHQQLWKFKEAPSSKELIRKIVATVVEISIRTLFGNFIYTCGGKLFLQLKGGPTGARVTMAVAQLIMEWFWIRIKAIFLESGQLYTLHLGMSYVDDVRALIGAFPKGTRFSDGKFRQSGEDDGLLTREEVTKRAFQDAINSVVKCLKFTTELQNEFEDNWLPTLDTEMKTLAKENRITLRFYKKPMSSSWLLPEESATAPE